jgi:4-methyl-5(b-hydroxyethyl)-thiazole monophosphate biosynthesis
MKTVLVPLAQGCEEIEAVTVVDVLRRAGITVVTAGLDAGPVKASRGTVLVPDTTLADATQQTFDMVVLPGGQPGTDNLGRDPRISELITSMARQEKYVCAICAAPKVLAQAGVLSGRRATSFPGSLEKLGRTDITLTESAVEKDGRVITSRGPGTAMDFALELVEVLAGHAKRVEVENGLVRSR